MMVPMKVKNQMRRQLIYAVWHLLVKNTKSREDKIAEDAMNILCKLSNDDLDTLGTILMEKQS